MPQHSSREQFRHTLKPVFTTLVTGHRKSRLSASGYEALDARLMNCLSAILRTVHTEASQAFNAGRPIYEDAPATCRLLTGVADGADEIAANVAHAAQHELHMLAPGRAADAGFTEPEPDRAVALGMKPTGATDRQLRQSDYSLRDNLALNFSDLLIVVWDGHEPFPMNSGTALMVQTALSRRKPVIWIDIGQAADLPGVWVTEPGALTDTALTELDVLGATPELLRKLFIPVSVDSAQLSEAVATWLQGLLVPFATVEHPDNPERQLRHRIGRQSSLLGYLWQWLTFAASRVGLTEARRPLSLGAWAKGGMLWFQVMLSPPKRSTALRIHECLHSDVRAFSWQENLMSRVHGFFSELVKLSPRRAISSLSHPPLVATERPPAPDEPSKPIVETDLPAFFRWADAQARVFSTRHRDDTWVIYYAAAFAVFCAVAGATYLWPAGVAGWTMTWVILEFVALRFVVGRVLIARFKGWHGRWMSYRYLAEQLRMARLGFPLLAMPSGFRQSVWEPDPDPHGNPIHIVRPEAWILQRILIAEGLPQSVAGKVYFRITHHNEAILRGVNRKIADNMDYYHRLHERLHRDHHYLHRFSLILFGLTFLAVISHFVLHLPGILFFTAFFPAWGAAIHGILTQNEVGRISSMAAQTWQRLNTLDTAMKYHQTITESGIQLNDQSLAWARTRELRGLVRATVDTLENENSQWVALLQHNETDLPA